MRPWLIPLLIALLLGVIAARMLIGGLSTANPEILHTLLELRASRIASGVIAGGSLALAGALLQSLLRNPLASPDLLGLSSGAGLGVMIAIYASFLAGFGLADAGGLWGVGSTTAAIIASCLTLALVYTLARRGFSISPTSLVLMGVIIAIIASALISLLKHLMPDQGVAADRLLVGNLRDDTSLTQIILTGSLLIAGVFFATSQAKAMDVASVSDEEASSLGVDVAKLRIMQFLIAGVLTGGAVVLAGPVAFVGLLCPHMIRSLAGPQARRILIGSAILGALTIVAADTLIAIILELRPGFGRLPLGILTALAGGPIFLLMLRRSPATQP